MMKRSSRIMAFFMALLLALSVAATAMAAYATIPYGEQSDNVRRMQMKLKDKGYYRGTVDGKFGPATRKAVVKFQTAVGLTPDGKPGDKTLTALYNGVGAINGGNPSLQKQLQQKPTNPTTLYYGCRGARVRALQRALKHAGVFGDLTHEAVIKYQRKAGLSADGMAGPRTLESLRKATGVSISKSFVLDIGSQGNEVRTLTEWLTDQGYLASPTSLYNYGVADAVRQWQTVTGKTVTGTVTEAQYNNIIGGKE